MSRSAPLELRLIGELAVLRDGAPVKLPASRKTRALLAYLAGTGTAHRRDRLCSLLWEIPDDPKASLRWSLSKLRGLLDDPAGCGCCRKARRCGSTWPAPGRPRRAARLCAICDTDRLEALAEAIGAGRFCDGLELPRCEEFEAWCAAMREDVRQLLIAMHRELAGGSPIEPDRALPSLRRLTELEQFDAALREQLVATLVEAGRPAEAEAQRRIAVGIARRRPECRLPAALSPSRLSPAAVAGAGRSVPADAACRRQQVQFCTAPDGTGIAYSCTGAGRRWSRPPTGSTISNSSGRARSGATGSTSSAASTSCCATTSAATACPTGRSADLSFEAFVQDLETVVDAAELDRFDLIGISQGCAVAIAYAVQPSRSGCAG